MLVTRKQVKTMRKLLLTKRKQPRNMCGVLMLDKLKGTVTLDWDGGQKRYIDFAMNILYTMHVMSHVRLKVFDELKQITITSL
jgi:hypothetical protein